MIQKTSTLSFTTALLALLSTSLVSTQAFSVSLNLDTKIRKERNAEFYKSALELLPLVTAEQGVFDQKIDHFSKSKRETFKQRYWIQSEWAANSNSPVFFVICGESECDGADSMSAINAIAKKYKMHLVALEHRFYGHSYPYSDLSSKNLKMLSTDQALEDLSDFQNWVRLTKGLSGKWISVGGSYPGSLSAFYRLKHPEQVVGALASSAPVRAKADFWEYDRHVARVAGQQCLNQIQLAVAQAEHMLSSSPEQGAQVKKWFEVENFKDTRDVLYVLADTAAFAIQYGFQKDFCDALINSKSSEGVLKDYADIGLSLLSRYGITPYDMSFVSAESEDIQQTSGAGMRAWVYQSCTEYGYFQNANQNRNESARSSLITGSFHQEICKRLFGLKNAVPENETNNKYYNELLKPSVKNIYFTNGSNDPWINLSIAQEVGNQSINPNLIAFTISGASHCEDLGSRFSSSLQQARSQFSQLIATWIAE